MDVKLNEDSLNYQIIGGVFDFWFMAGPTPVDVAKQVRIENSNSLSDLF